MTTTLRPGHSERCERHLQELIIWLRWIWRCLSRLHFATESHSQPEPAEWKWDSRRIAVFVFVLFRCNFSSFRAQFFMKFLLFLFSLWCSRQKERFKCLISRYVEHSICYFVLAIVPFSAFMLSGAVNPTRCAIYYPQRILCWFSDDWDRDWGFFGCDF